jgi:hypothetical protein
MSFWIGLIDVIATPSFPQRPYVGEVYLLMVEVCIPMFYAPKAPVMSIFWRLIRLYLET